VGACAPKQNSGNRLNYNSDINPDTPMHPTREGHRTAVPVEFSSGTSVDIKWPSEVRIQDVSVQEVKHVGEKVQVKTVYSYRDQRVEVTLEGVFEEDNESNVAYLYQTSPVRPKLLFGNLFCLSSTSCKKPRIELFYRTPEGTLETVQVFASSEGERTPIEIDPEDPSRDELEEAPAASTGTEISTTTSSTQEVTVPADEMGAREEDERPGRYVGIEINNERALTEISQLETPSEKVVVGSDVQKEPAVEDSTQEEPPAPENFDTVREEVRRARRRPTATEFHDQYIQWVNQNGIERIDSLDWRDEGTLRTSVLVPGEERSGDCIQWKTTNSNHLWGSSLAYYFLAEVSRYYCVETNDSSTLVVTSASLRQGGDTPHHGSHENGLDVDIRYPRNGFSLNGTVIHNGEMIRSGKIRENTWTLLKIAFETGAVERFIVHPAVVSAMEQYANSIGESATFQKMTRKFYERNDHDDHIHFQLYCSPINQYCQETAIGED